MPGRGGFAGRGRYAHWKKKTPGAKGKIKGPEKVVPKGPRVSLEICSLKKFQANNVNQADALRAFRQIPGSLFDAKGKTWSFPLKEYQKLINLLGKLPVHVVPIPKIILKMAEDCVQEKKAQESRSLDFSQLPDDLAQKLLQFQWGGLKFALSHQGKCMICDEMGLGKTIQAVAVAACFQKEWPLLIIVPSSLRYNWEAEILKWLPQYKHKISVVSDGKGQVNKLINIISYTLVDSLKDKLEAAKFGVVICDESHYIKNSEAKRTKAILPLLKSVKRRILLSGTPAVSRPAELYCQLDSLDAPIFDSFHDFGLRYCAAYYANGEWDYSGSSNLTELNVLLNETVMIRRLKADVLSELPPKTRHFIKMQPDQQYKAELLKCKEKMANQAAGVAKAGGNAALITKLQQKKSSYLAEFYSLSGKAKASQAIVFLKEQIAKGQDKILVFAHHVEVLDQLVELCKKNSMSFLRVDGSTKPEDKSDKMHSFNTDPSITIFLLSLTCAGVGFTLTVSSCVLFVELFWTPGSLIQAEDRVHRIGQKKEVHIHYLLCDSTIDDLIWPTISRKLDVIGRSVDGRAGLSMETKKKNSLIDTTLKLVGDLPDDPIDGSPKKKKRKAVEDKSDDVVQPWKKVKLNPPSALQRSSSDSAIGGTRKLDLMNYFSPQSQAIVVPVPTSSVMVPAKFFSSKSSTQAASSNDDFIKPRSPKKPTKVVEEPKKASASITRVKPRIEIEIPKSPVKSKRPRIEIEEEEPRSKPKKKNQEKTKSKGESGRLEVQVEREKTIILKRKKIVESPKKITKSASVIDITEESPETSNVIRIDIGSSSGSSDEAQGRREAEDNKDDSSSSSSSDGPSRPRKRKKTDRLLDGDSEDDSGIDLADFATQDNESLDECYNEDLDDDYAPGASQFQHDDEIAYSIEEESLSEIIKKKKKKRKQSEESTEEAKKSKKKKKTKEVKKPKKKEKTKEKRKEKTKENSKEKSKEKTKEKRKEKTKERRKEKGSEKSKENEKSKSTKTIDLLEGEKELMELEKDEVSKSPLKSSTAKSRKNSRKTTEAEPKKDEVVVSKPPTKSPAKSPAKSPRTKKAEKPASSSPLKRPSAGDHKAEPPKKKPKLKSLDDLVDDSISDLDSQPNTPKSPKNKEATKPNKKSLPEEKVISLPKPISSPKPIPGETKIVSIDLDPPPPPSLLSKNTKANKVIPKMKSLDELMDTYESQPLDSQLPPVVSRQKEVQTPNSPKFNKVNPNIKSLDDLMDNYESQPLDSQQVVLNNQQEKKEMSLGQLPIGAKLNNKVNMNTKSISDLDPQNEPKTKEIKKTTKLIQRKSSSSSDDVVEIPKPPEPVKPKTSMKRGFENSQNPSSDPMFDELFDDAFDIGIQDLIGAQPTPQPIPAPTPVPLSKPAKPVVVPSILSQTGKPRLLGKRKRVPQSQQPKKTIIEEKRQEKVVEMEKEVEVIGSKGSKVDNNILDEVDSDLFQDQFSLGIDDLLAPSLPVQNAKQLPPLDVLPESMKTTKKFNLSKKIRSK